MSNAERDDRASIQPEDWPLEEGGDQAQPGLRSDIGTSQDTPKTESPEDASSGDGAPGSRGQLGTATPTSKGAEQGPR